MRRFDTFLIVEDDPNIRVLLEELFHFEGFAVVTMENGQDAILWLREHQPALVILDLPLPPVPGEGVLAELLTLYNGAVPCITMTAGSRPVGAKRAQGGWAHIPKPFTLDHMCNTVFAYLPVPHVHDVKAPG
jgi:DNA-binding response OmpR family regulator